MPNKREIELFFKEFERAASINLTNSFRQAMSKNQDDKPVEDNIKTFEDNIYGGDLNDEDGLSDLLSNLDGGTENKESKDSSLDIDNLLSSTDFGIADGPTEEPKSSSDDVQNVEIDTPIEKEESTEKISSENIGDTDDLNFDSLSDSKSFIQDSNDDFSLDGDNSDLFASAENETDNQPKDTESTESASEEDFTFDDTAFDFDTKSSLFDFDTNIDTNNENNKNRELNLKHQDLTDEELSSLQHKSTVTADEEESTFDEQFGDGASKKKKKKSTYTISDSDFASIEKYIKQFPLNIRIVIQEHILNPKQSEEDVIELLDMLNRELPLKTIVKYLSEKRGEIISIPKSFETLSGEKFLNEMATPFYIFKTKILPLAMKITAISAMVIFVLWGVSFYIFPPMRADYNYRAGYRALKNEKYELSVEYFEKAFSIWKLKKQFYKYADGYISKRQYILAEKFYDKMLLPENYYYDKRGRLDYGRLESEILGNYQKADYIMQVILDQNRVDYDALLETGKNFLRWGDYKPEKYESARFNFALAGEEYGYNDEIMFQFLHYAIKTKKHKDIMDIKDRYLDGIGSRKKIDPYIFSKLAGYLTDRGDTDNVLPVFQRIFKQDSNNIYAYYEMARYNRKINLFDEMEKTANYVIYYMKNESFLTAEKVKMRTLSYNMKGIAQYDRKEFLDSERNFQTAIDMYEDFLERNILHPSAEFGEIYFNLGNIFYYDSSEYDIAYIQYQKAEENNFSSPDLKYKKGFVDYKNGRYKDALLEFFQSAQTFSSNLNLMYATANTLFKREDYNASLGYYYHIIDILENEKYNMKGFNPDEKIEHYQVVDGLVRSYNNMGVALFNVYNETGKYAKYVEALANLQKANEYKDALLREKRSKIGQSIEATLSMLNLNTALAADNINSIMYPTKSSSVLIYDDIPLDFTKSSFGVRQ